MFNSKKAGLKIWFLVFYNSKNEFLLNSVLIANKISVTKKYLIIQILMYKI